MDIFYSTYDKSLGHFSIIDRRRGDIEADKLGISKLENFYLAEDTVYHAFRVLKSSLKHTSKKSSDVIGSVFLFTGKIIV